jgi:hypothetical protein
MKKIKPLSDEDEREMRRAYQREYRSRKALQRMEEEAKRLDSEPRQRADNPDVDRFLKWLQS